VVRFAARLPGLALTVTPAQVEGRTAHCAVPDLLKAELSEYLERFGLADDEALVFTSPLGTPLRDSNFYRRAWMPAVAKVGLPGIHFHDLRHAGNTLTADAGASLRELMDRIGHSSTRAALTTCTRLM
jgi:integrase